MDDYKIAYDVQLRLFTGLACNLRCRYCFNWINNIVKNTFLQRLYEYRQHNIIDTPRFLAWLKTMEKTFLISLCGGEPFLYPDLIDFCRQVTCDHYLEIVTNLTIPNVSEFASKIDPKRVNLIASSMHIVQLLKHGLLDSYIDNYLLLREKKFHLESIVVAHPENIAVMKQYEDKIRSRGVDFIYRPYFGRYRLRMYPQAYTDSQLSQLNIPHELVAASFHFGKPCNAGVNSFVLDPSGTIRPCYETGKIVGKLYDKIDFPDTLFRCPSQRCACPIWYMNPQMFSKAAGSIANRSHLLK